MISFILTSLNPVKISTAASADKGILLNNPGIKTTQSKSKMPLIMVDFFDFAPAFTFTELLTITEAMGNPPIKPEIILPIPWAFNSLFVGVILFSGSSLSIASTANSVSKLAIMAKENAIPQIDGLSKLPKLGSVKKEIKSAKSLGIGRLTK